MHLKPQEHNLKRAQVSMKKMKNIINLKEYGKFDLNNSEEVLDYFIFSTKDKHTLITQNLYNSPESISLSELNSKFENLDTVIKKQILCYHYSVCFYQFFVNQNNEFIFNKYFFNNFEVSDLEKISKISKLKNQINQILESISEDTTITDFSDTLENRDSAMKKLQAKFQTNLIVVPEQDSYVKLSKNFYYHLFYFFGLELKKISDLIELNFSGFLDKGNTSIKSKTSSQKQNLYTHIFKDNAFEIWQSMFDSFKINESSRTDVKFMYEEMKKDGLIYPTVNQTSFLEWIYNTYNLNIEKISNHSKTPKRESIYNSAKQLYKNKIN